MGTTFTGATAVKFGSTNATSFKVESETKITAVAPAGGDAGCDRDHAQGTSATSSADQFSYVAALPTVTKVEPNRGVTEGGTLVTITGANLTGATAVKFGSTNEAPSRSTRQPRSMQSHPRAPALWT